MISIQQIYNFLNHKTMNKYIALIATFLFFASVTVFQIPMMQDDGNTDLSLTEKVTIMANAGDGGDGDEDDSFNEDCYDEICEVGCFTNGSWYPYKEKDWDD